MTVSPSGASLAGEMLRGELHGRGREHAPPEAEADVDAEGNDGGGDDSPGLGEVVFDGRYERGARHGAGVAALGGGGALLARWYDGELPEGRHAAVYAYSCATTDGKPPGPCLGPRLLGVWEGGAMLRAEYASAATWGAPLPDASADGELAAILGAAGDGADAAEAALDELRGAHARASGRLAEAGAAFTPEREYPFGGCARRDPYEAAACEARPTPEMGIGEYGLFAARALPAGATAAFFTGRPIATRDVRARGGNASSDGDGGGNGDGRVNAFVIFGIEESEGDGNGDDGDASGGDGNDDGDNGNNIDDDSARNNSSNAGDNADGLDGDGGENEVDGGSDTSGECNGDGEDECIEVPFELALPREGPGACPHGATLGHLAHHSGAPSCELVRVEHPRFPLGCAALVARRSLAAGDELTLDYAVCAPLRTRYADCLGEAGYYYHLRTAPCVELYRCVIPAIAGCWHHAYTYTRTRTRACGRARASCPSQRHVDACTPSDMSARAAPLYAGFKSASSRVAAHGTLRVTRHGPWRVLWFGATEQGLSRARVASAERSESGGDCPEEHDPRALGFEYIATMARHAEVELRARWLPAELEPRASAPTRGCEVVCVGLGTGALPAYLAHALGGIGARVTAVELDSDVVSVAQEVLGVAMRVRRGGRGEGERSPKRARAGDQDGGEASASAHAFDVVVCDAAEWFEEHCAGGLAAVLLDAYDAEGKVPSHLKEPAFLRRMGASLAPGGIAVANVWRTADDFEEFVNALGTAVCGPADGTPGRTQAGAQRVRVERVARDDVNVTLVAVKPGLPGL